MGINSTSYNTKEHPPQEHQDEHGKSNKKHIWQLKQRCIIRLPDRAALHSSPSGKLRMNTLFLLLTYPLIIHIYISLYLNIMLTKYYEVLMERSSCPCPLIVLIHTITRDFTHSALYASVSSTR
jgi:hypothetical protein